MKPVDRIEGTLLPIDRSDVDTDQILPGQFLKRVERHGFEDCLFYEWARDDPAFVLNRPEFRGARILVAGRNFGTGSSREHAVWAIQDWGIGAVVAPSFGDIFFANCVNVGVIPVVLGESVVEDLIAAATIDPATMAVVDLGSKTVHALGRRYEFSLDEDARRRLLEGLDAIDLTMQHLDAIEAHESRRPRYRPSL